VVEQWHAPDHTKIEEFRSRLAPETQRQVTNAIVLWATQLGFAHPAVMDIDSTVQEANIAYPSDAHLMVKMTLLAGKVWRYLKQNTGSSLTLPQLLMSKQSKPRPKPTSLGHARTESRPMPP